MAGGLAALLDDVAMIAKLASSAGTKALGVVVDDSAVTPRYVHGFSPARELPIIWQIAKGSLRNKLVIILPIAILLSQFAPMLLPPILMVGGAYLCFEGAEKVLEHFTGGDQEHTEPVMTADGDQEKKMVRGAITTDLILSTEIMVISLNQLSQQAFWPRLISLILVGVFMTAVVYGAVAIIVKMDDVGLRLAENGPAGRRALGRALVAGMPKVMSVLSAVGIVAMLWVGGHILITEAHNLGWHVPHELLHQLTEPIGRVAVAGGALAWLVETLTSALVGLLLGMALVGIVHLLPFGHHRSPDSVDEPYRPVTAGDPK